MAVSDVFTRIGKILLIQLEVHHIETVIYTKPHSF